MKILVVGGSASNVGKVALAEFGVARESSLGRAIAIKVSVREKTLRPRGSRAFRLAVAAH